MGKGKQEYELDLDISLQGLTLAPGPDGKQKGAADIFYNIVMAVIAKHSENQKGLNGFEHDLVKNIRTVFEAALEKKETKVMLRDRELRWINKMFVDIRTDLSSNEVRFRVKEKIQGALDPERKGQEAQEGISIEEGVQQSET